MIALRYEVADSASHADPKDVGGVLAGGAGRGGRDGAGCTDPDFCGRLATVLGGELSARPESGGGACVRFAITLRRERGVR